MKYLNRISFVIIMNYFVPTKKKVHKKDLDRAIYEHQNLKKVCKVQSKRNLIFKISSFI